MHTLVAEPTGMDSLTSSDKCKARQLEDVRLFDVPAEQIAISERNSKLSPFLRLPPELRNRVYQLVLTDWTIHLVTDETPDKRDCRPAAVAAPADARRCARHMAFQHGSVHDAMDVIEDKTKTSASACGAIKPFWRTSRHIYFETRLMVFSPRNRFLVSNYAHAGELAAALSHEQLAGMRALVYATGDGLEACLRNERFQRPIRAYWLGDAVKRAEHKFWSRSNKHIGEFYAFDWIIEMYRRGIARMPLLCRAYGVPFTIEDGPLGPDVGVLPPSLSSSSSSSSVSLSLLASEDTNDQDIEMTDPDTMIFAPAPPLQTQRVMNIPPSRPQRYQGLVN